MNDMTNPWWKRGACLGSDVTLWLHPRHPRELRAASQQRRTAACRTICKTCTVREVCLADALACAGETSFRGGLTYEERLPLGQKMAPTGRAAAIR